MSFTGRPATGSIYIEGGHWKCRITVDGVRHRDVLFRASVARKEDAPADELRRAQDVAEQLSRTAREHGAESIADARAQLTIPSDETVSEYSVRWLAWKEGKGQSTVCDSRGRLRKWALPVLGDIPIRMVKRDDLQRC